VRRSNWHQTASEVAPLAASEASSDIQGGINKRWRHWRLRQCLPQHQHTWATLSRRLFQFVLCSHPMLRCWLSQEREASSLAGHFQSRPRTPGTHYRLTLDPAVYCGHFQTTPQDPPVQTVLTRCHQRLCIFGLYGAVQMLFYNYLFIYYYFYRPWCCCCHPTQHCQSSERNGTERNTAIPNTLFILLPLIVITVHVTYTRHSLLL